MDAKETGISILKSVFSNIPIAGQFLSEILFEYRGRVKQNRLNEFTQLLADHFAEHQNLDFSTLNKVEFSDILEWVILRVVRTDSKEKHQRFRDILINYIEIPTQSIDHAETFLDLISSLNEPSIQILKYHDRHDQEFEKLDRQDGILRDTIEKTERRLEQQRESQKNIMTILPRDPNDEIPKLKRELYGVEAQIEKLEKYRKASFYGLSEDDFLYLKQILVSKALLTDSGIGSIGHIPYFHMRITMFGKQFISYLKKNKENDH